jgi:hypothetical protein
MVTAELAVALPAVVLTALVAASALGVVAAQLRALDAAAVAARLAARGESVAAVAAAVHAVAADGSYRLRGTTGSTRLVIAEVTVRVSPPGLGRWLPAFTVREQAAAPPEPIGPEPVAMTADRRDHGVRPQ